MSDEQENLAGPDETADLEPTPVEKPDTTEGNPADLDEA